MIAQKIFSNFYEWKIKKFYHQRNIQAVDENILKLKKYNVHKFWFWRHYIDRVLGDKPSFLDWQTLYDRVPTTNKKLRKVIHHEMVLQLIVEKNTERSVVLFLQGIESFGFKFRDAQKYIGILHLLMENQSYQQARDFKESCFAKISSPVLHKKISLMTSEIHFKLDTFFSQKLTRHRWIETFDILDKLQLYGKSNLLYEVKVDHCRLQRASALLLDIRFSQAEQDQLLGAIADAIKNSKPYLLLRLGDGESYAFMGDKHSGDMNVRENKWWGQPLASSTRNHICQLFKQAYYQADCLGIPSCYRFYRDYLGMNLKDYLTFNRIESVSQRGLKSIHRQLIDDYHHEKISKQVVFCEHRCHQTVFRLPQIKKLMQWAPQTIIVSKYAQAPLAALFESEKVAFFQIPGERQGNTSLPYHVDDYTSSLLSLLRPGDLVLVGAGFAGKGFLAAAKSAGCVALDVGSMVDHWLGHHTRQIADFV
ncbi:MAG: hypothetical protein KDK51_00380 [Deltaproteobacteria bacterium]|nr:hypothetical protein [Deltaproteobacteria bacterium]